MVECKIKVEGDRVILKCKVKKYKNLKPSPPGYTDKYIRWPTKRAAAYLVEQGFKILGPVDLSSPELNNMIESRCEQTFEFRIEAKQKKVVPKPGKNEKPSKKVG